MTAAHPHMEPGKKYRLITRSDMDGLVCAVILRELGLIDEIEFAHPKDMQDGIIQVGPDDITTNLPYVEGVHLCFDHHASEATRVQGDNPRHVIEPDKPSAARVVFDYFGGSGNPALRNVSDAIMKAVDKADAANFSRDNILNPTGWELLSFLMDARTGLGRFRTFSISNYQLMKELIEYCRENHSIDEILQMPHVKERVDLYMEHRQKFREQIERCSTVHKNLVVLDLRDEPTIWAGNRFLIYALFPQCNISMHVMWGKNQQNTALAIGKSILNRTSYTHVGNLCLDYGGGGHEGAGGCQIDNDKAGQVIREIIARINADG